MIPPIHQTSTYVQPAPGEFVGHYDYSRSANPTRSALEGALGELEGGHGLAFSSGMAATHALLTARLLGGRPRGPAARPLRRHLPARGQDPHALRARVRHGRPDGPGGALGERFGPRRELVWVETPTNPLLNVVDIEAVVERSGDALVAVDNTFATPVIQRPLELGADAVMHSTTKYLGGHSDVVGGALVVRR